MFDYGTSHKVPLAPKAIAQIECRTHQVFLSGDHAIVAGLIDEARLAEGRPLLYYARQYGSFVPFTSLRG
jgi:flavin reductase (DIM6/NTAB) family NADH-FMN oxidoreductase RutF